MAKLPPQGLKDIQHLRKSINEDEEDNNVSKYIKLKFTRRQYETFRNACNIFSVVASHPGFNDFVNEALETKVTSHTLNIQMVNPINTSLTKIYDPIVKKSIKNKNVTHEPKITYFNQPREVTESCISLYDKVKDINTLHTQYDVLEGQTSITDIRTMLGKYIIKYDLKNEYGTIFDDFLQHIAPKTFNENKYTLLIVDDHFVIPKNDKKLIYGIINNIVFSK